ncbi:MAG: Spy0128 family protein [Eggerthellaceae bacterium]
MSAENTKHRRMSKGFLVAIVALVAALGAFAVGSGFAADNWTQAADTSTAPGESASQFPNAGDQASTAEVGRIYTDKSVTQGSNNNFNVSLSALSSAAKGTTKTVQDTDIVLVLDVSGSMNRSYSTGNAGDKTYVPVYNQPDGTLNPEGRYFIKKNGYYYSLDYRDGGWYYGQQAAAQGPFTPKTSAADDNADHVQFYVSVNQASDPKITALQNSVNQFIDHFDDLNKENSSVDNRIAVVQFAGKKRDSGTTYNSYYQNYQEYNYTRVVSDFTDDFSDLKDKVNSLYAAGNTRSDYGLELAQDLLKNSGNRNKIVIFFTDGEPTGINDQDKFDSQVADNAVDIAKTMKASGTTIYTIGATSDADPTLDPTLSTTSNQNVFMNAVSSKYPKASKNGQIFVGTNGHYSPKNLTNPAEGQYYYAATDSDQLVNAFENIYSQIATSTGYPTNTTNGAEDSSGYVTFTDKTGSYTEVKSVDSLVFGGNTYSVSSSSTDQATNTTTYVFTNGSTSPKTNLTDSVDLSKIIVTVQKGADDKTGDTVIMKIPAADLPVTLYDTTTDNTTNTTTMQRTDDQPVRLNYTVGIKGSADDANTVLGKLNSEDPATAVDASYLNANTSSDGKLYFYSNDYQKNSSKGATTVGFTPASNNSYYKFTENTPIYTSNDGSDIQATSINDDSTYYYKVTYYTLPEGSNSGTPTAHTEYKAISGSELSSIGTATDGNKVYIPAGKNKPVSSDENQAKTTNLTDTASNVIEVTHGDNVAQYLGNNGRIGVPMPGKLAITKKTDVADGSNVSADKTFEFTVTLKDEDGNPLSGSYNYKKSNDTTTYTISNGGKVSLKKDETITISGLPAGSQYVVTETTQGSGWSLKSSENASGTIKVYKKDSNLVDLVTAKFTNEYKYTSNTGQLPPIEKNITGRDFKSGDSFTFQVTGTYKAPDNTALTVDSVPLPAKVNSEGKITITPTSSTTSTLSPDDLGNITFSTPGTYTYTIKELPGSDTTITYDDDTTYTVTFKVTDNGSGQLQVERTFTGEKATFTNKYTPEDTSVDLVGNKEFTDSTSNTTLQADQFTFKIEPVGNAPKPKDKDGNVITTVKNKADGSIDLGKLNITSEMVDNTYTYNVTEVIPDGATKNEDGTWTKDGVTYDGKTHTIKVTVSNDNGTLKADVVYDDATDNTSVKFSNSYKANPATATVKGDKTLTGRDMKDGETYTFTLAANAATQTAIDNGYITSGTLTKEQLKNMTTTVTGGTNGDNKSFSFDTLTFSHVGEYTYTMSEKVPEGATENSDGTYTKAGVTYDVHKCTVTIEVTDENGQLKAAITYDPEKGYSFSNTYTASTTYPGINISKTLNGRGLNAGEFKFTITGNDTDSTAKLTDNADKNFSNPNGKADGEEDVWSKLSSLEFDQSDAGKTYSYTVKETKESLGGVTYDETAYTVTIEVKDNGDGTMYTVTTVKNGDKQVAQASTKTDANAKVKVPFVNEYSATGTLDGATNLKVTKNLTGRDWKDGDSFKFTLAGGDPATKQAITDGDVVLPKLSTITIDNDTTSHEEAFGDITFKKAGDYVFTVTETKGNIAGISYDTTVKTIYVSVTDDNHNGTFTVTKTEESDALTFTNEYKPTSVTDTIGLKKNMENRNFKDGDTFSFSVTGAYTGSATNVDVPMPNALTGVTTNANGSKTGTWTWSKSNDSSATDSFTLTSNDLEFKAAGTYTYTITENTGDIAGVKYSSAQYTYTIVVTDNGNGKLVVDSKKLTQQINDVAGTVDNTEVDAATFTNKAAKDATAAFKGTKTYTDNSGKKPLEDGMFSFTLTAETEGAPMPEGTEDGTYTVSNTGSNVQFPEIKYGQDNVGNTYTYNIKEVNGGQAGMNYDGNDHKVTVTVTQDPTTKVITATVTYADGANGAVFTNTYTPTPVTESIVGTKTFNGRDMGSNESVGFTLKAADDSTAQALQNGTITGGTNSATVTGLKNGVKTSFNFNSNNAGFTFTKPGTYTFTMAETPGTAGGVSYDSHTCKVKVVVTDTSGVLSADVTYELDSGTQTGEAANDFVNTYSTGSAKVPVSVKKTLTGRTPGLQAGEFSFTMTVTPSGDSPADGFTLPEGASDGALTVSNAADGSVSFGNITFTKPGTYHVAVKENVPADADKAKFMTYDENTYEFDVVVTDNGNGGLTTQKTNVTGSDTFENTYNPPEDKKTVSTLDDDNIKIEDANGQMVSVGQKLRYTVNWVNDAVDSETGKSVAAKVTVTDTIPTGTVYVDGTAKAYDANGEQIGTGTISSGTITWDLGEQEAGATGTVIFDVKVDKSVLNQVGDIPSFSNQATVKVGDNSHKTNTVTNTVPKKQVLNEEGTVDLNGKTVQVGDTLTFNVYYKNTEDTAGTVTITDKLSDGLTFVSASDNGQNTNGTITWTLENVAAGKSGYVSFKAKVNEKAVALADKTIENTATLKVGDGTYDTNTTTNTVETGNLSITKTVQADDGYTADPTKEFTFTVTLTDKNGQALTEDYSYTKSDNTTGTIKSGGTITLKSGETATINDLPDGATWTVTEASDNYYKPDQATKTGTIDADKTDTASVSFTNTYQPGTTEVSLKVKKTLTGRTPGLQSGEFSFKAEVTGT